MNTRDSNCFQSALLRGLFKDKGDFDEKLHPRASDGKFSEVRGVAAAKPAPGAPGKAQALSKKAQDAAKKAAAMMAAGMFTEAKKLKGQAAKWSQEAQDALAGKVLEPKPEPIPKPQGDLKSKESVIQITNSKEWFQSWMTTKKHFVNEGFTATNDDSWKEGIPVPTFHRGVIFKHPDGRVWVAHGHYSGDYVGSIRVYPGTKEAPKAAAPIPKPDPKPDKNPDPPADPQLKESLALVTNSAQWHGAFDAAEGNFKLKGFALIHDNSWQDESPGIKSGGDPVVFINRKMVFKHPDGRIWAVSGRYSGSYVGSVRVHAHVGPWGIPPSPPPKAAAPPPPPPPPVAAPPPPPPKIANGNSGLSALAGLTAFPPPSLHKPEKETGQSRSYEHYKSHKKTGEIILQEQRRLTGEGFVQTSRKMVSGNEVLEFEHPDSRKARIEASLSATSVHVKYSGTPIVKEPKGKAKGPPGSDPKIMKSVKTPHDLMRDATESKGSFKSIEKITNENNSGGAYVVEYSDGHKAIFKPHAETGLEKSPWIRPTLDSSIPEHSREVAALEISNAAGFGICPHVEVVSYPTSMGKGIKQKGHVMAFIEGKAAFKEDKDIIFKAAAEGHPDLHRLAALDLITGNTDRHANNFFHGKDGRYYAIDTGLAFPKDSKTEQFRSGVLKGWPGGSTDGDGMLSGKSIPDQVVKEINALKPEHIVSAMKKAGFKEIDIKGAVSRHAALQSWMKRTAAFGGPAWPINGAMNSAQRILDGAKQLLTGDTIVW